MSNKPTKIVCPICGANGGVITRRRAGRRGSLRWGKGQGAYWYIGHYDPKKKTRKRWCYLDSEPRPLAKIRVADSEYKNYLKVLEDSLADLCKHFDYCMEVGYRKRVDACVRAGIMEHIDGNFLYNIDGYDDSASQNVLKSLKSMLVGMGWPAKLVDIKIEQDVYDAKANRMKKISDVDERLGLPEVAIYSL